MHSELFGHVSPWPDDVGSAFRRREGHATWYGLAAWKRRRRRRRNHSPTRSATSRAPRGLARRPSSHDDVCALRRGYRLAWTGAAPRDPPISNDKIPTPKPSSSQNKKAIDLAALHAELPAGCRFVIENSAGELGIAILLADLAAPDRAPPASASEGWAGDRYLAARCNDQREFVWLTLWDSEADAREFESAYLLVASARAAHPVTR
jgi:hypothetical protein